MKNLFLFIFAIASINGYSQKLEPTETQALLTVLVVNEKEKPLEGITVSFFATKDNNVYSGIAKADGKFQILVPKGDKYKVQYKATGSYEDYNFLDLPSVEGVINFNYKVNVGPPKVTSDIRKITYQGKLLIGDEEKEPLKNQKVLLLDNKNVEVQSSITDKYGDFSFKDVNIDKAYIVEILDNGMKIKDGQVFMARQDGMIIKNLKKSGKFFIYELLPAELFTIAQEKEEDTELKISNFSSSKQNELTVDENIYYTLNSSEINNESKSKLDKIIDAMQINKSIRLTIASHTDSKGDDESNMRLSEKRAQKVLEYFLEKGITKERLSAKGFGETQIKNRCKNGVDCSEKEHELNRRTEFKFSK